MQVKFSLDGTAVLTTLRRDVVAVSLPRVLAPAIRIRLAAESADCLFPETCSEVYQFVDGPVFWRLMKLLGLTSSGR